MADLFDQIFDTIKSQDFLEYAGLIFGVFYVILAANNKIICWVFGIISCTAIAIKDFGAYQLYADGALQLFYIVMGFAGLYLWKFGKSKNQERPISKLTIGKHMPYFLGIIALSLIGGYLFDQYTNAQFPFLDSLTTLVSIYATFLLVYRIADNWILWIFADLIYVYLYYSREAYFFALLMIIYTLIAVFGMVNWQKKYKQQAKSI